MLARPSASTAGASSNTTGKGGIPAHSVGNGHVLPTGATTPAPVPCTGQTGRPGAQPWAGAASDLSSVVPSSSSSSSGAKTPYSTCPHLAMFKGKDKSGLQSFQITVQYVTALELNRGQIPPITCATCTSHANPLHVCVHCVYVGCSRGLGQGGHMQAHHTKQPGHTLALDLTHRQLLCFTCGDYVYDSELDNILAQTIRASETNHILALTDRDRAALSHHATRRVPSVYTGLRGLHNLGATCFMNTILQALLHVPMLRTYFLSDMHNASQCSRRARKEVCLGCEMDLLVTEAFNGTMRPYSAHRLLHSMWKVSDTLAGYEQQDAHEFLIELLDGIHKHCDGLQSQCRCIIHHNLSGVMRSDVTCETCGHTSSTSESFFDLSLSLQKDGAYPDTTLIECLQRFTHGERLSSWMCSRCHTHRSAVKQLSIQSLPPVLCIHFKRFEFGNRGSKVNAYVGFPSLWLDMFPFTSEAVRSDHSPGMTGGTAGVKGGTTVPHSGHGSSVGNKNKETVYELFGVVNHVGTLDTGHYTNYIQHAGDWYKCDDAKITTSTLRDVTQSQAYLLFYSQRRKSNKTTQ